MIRYFRPQRKQSAGNLLYATADDNVGFDLKKQWHAVPYSDVETFLRNGWKFYYKHDLFLYNLDKQSQREPGGTGMKVVEGDSVGVSVNLLATGDTFRYQGKYFMRTDATGYIQVVNLTSGRTTVLDGSAMVERVNMEARVVRNG